MKFHLLKFYFLALFLCSCAIEKPCTLKLEQAPELRGFKLGMSLQEVRQKFSNFPQPKTLEYGKSIALVDSLYIPGLSDVKEIEIEFVDEKIVRVKVFYKNDLKWSANELAQRTAEAMKLDGSWKKVGEDSYTSKIRSTYCDRFKVEAGIEKRLIDNLRLPYVEIENFWASFEPDSRRIKTQEEANKKQEEKKKVFQP